MRYNVAYDPLGTVHNAPITSAPGEELHPPILSILSIHGGHIKRGDRQVRFTGDMGVLTHWGGAGNGGTAGDRGIYLPPP